LGYDNFDELEGANEMDEHFKTEDFDKKYARYLSIIEHLVHNFFGAESEALIPYTQYLQKLAPYLQQEPWK
jgi:glucose-6-phosphate isomerase